MTDFKLYCRVIVIKTAWYTFAERERGVHQRIRLEDPEVSPPS
jgi:hypothetical protein